MKAMPPGFHLVRNDKGQWRSAFDGSKVILHPYNPWFPQTKRCAIRRAWGQYKFGIEEEERRRKDREEGIEGKIWKPV